MIAPHHSQLSLIWVCSHLLASCWSGEPDNPPGDEGLQKTGQGPLNTGGAATGPGARLSKVPIGTVIEGVI